MKSKEFGASYRTYNIKSQPQISESVLAQPYSSVGVLTENINQSPVEFMQYFRSVIMEAPPKPVKREPTVPEQPMRSSTILGSDGKPIRVPVPVIDPNTGKLLDAEIQHAKEAATEAGKKVVQAVEANNIEPTRRQKIREAAKRFLIDYANNNTGGLRGVVITVVQFLASVLVMWYWVDITRYATTYWQEVKSLYEELSQKLKTLVWPAPEPTPAPPTPAPSTPAPSTPAPPTPPPRSSPNYDEIDKKLRERFFSDMTNMMRKLAA